MIETNHHLPDPTELHAVKPVLKEKTLVGRLRLHPGQKVFELNRTTNEITEAEYEQGVVDFSKVAKGQISQLNHSLITRENCLYCVATRREIADKKFQKMLGLEPTKLTARNGKVRYVPARVVKIALQELAKQQGHD